MRPAHGCIALAFVLILGLPWALRPHAEARDASARRLVIITPHNQQIRHEFETAFDRWHTERFGEHITIDWRQPGGTTDIRKQLQAQYQRAVAAGAIAPDGSCPPGTMPYDLLFGGGSYEHDQMKKGVQATPEGAPGAVWVPISVPLALSGDDLSGLLGPNSIGAAPLWDPSRFWVGNALSGFGIVFNRDVLARLDLPVPDSWTALTDPRYAGWLALADPRQSSSVATTYDSILNNHGWDEGWRILRAMCANARAFTNSSSKIPIDVAQGEAAAGVAIDFYGRYQSQAMLQPGESPDASRVGYIDPPGVVFIDPDPISKLRGGPDPELADRFIEFTLSEEGQALWQLPARNGGPQFVAAARTGSSSGVIERIDVADRRIVLRGGDRIVAWDGRTVFTMNGEPSKRDVVLGVGRSIELSVREDGVAHTVDVAFGPQRYELRRMPARRSVYADLGDRFVDRGVDPFSAASAVESRGWRSAVTPMMAAFGIDSHHDLAAAWRALGAARAAGADPGRIAALEQRLFSMPVHTMADGSQVPFDEQNFAAIRADWAARAADGSAPVTHIAYTSFFRSLYRDVAREARGLTNSTPEHAQ